MGFTGSTSSTPADPQPELPRHQRSEEWASSTTTSLASSPSRSVSVSSGGSSVRCWRSVPHGVVFSRWNESDVRNYQQPQSPSSPELLNYYPRVTKQEAEKWAVLKFCLFSVSCHLLPRGLCDVVILTCWLFFLQRGSRSALWLLVGARLTIGPLVFQVRSGWRRRRKMWFRFLFGHHFLCVLLKETRVKVFFFLHTLWQRHANCKFW